MTVALIALGANIHPEGRRIKDALTEAAARLRECAAIRRVRLSRWFRAPAFPPGSGPDFVNGAAEVETGLEPAELLALLHGVEADMGRTRPARWAPRVCDIDLVAMGDCLLPDRATVLEWMRLDLGAAQTVVPPRLILPHPRMQERAFVLVPLADLAPEWRHPLTGLSVREMIAGLPKGEVEAVVALEG